MIVRRDHDGGPEPRPDPVRHVDDVQQRGGRAQRVGEVVLREPHGLDARLVEQLDLLEPVGVDLLDGLGRAGSPVRHEVVEPHGRLLGRSLIARRRVARPEVPRLRVTATALNA
jgi:hypothetical protein